MLRVLAGLLLVSAALSAAPQQPPGADAQALTLRGRIISADNEAVLRRVRVAVAMGTERIEPVFTDDDGRFAITFPSRAAAALTLSKAGFATTIVPLTPAALVGEIAVRLPRGAAITGRVVNAAGAPVAEAPVAARAVGGTGRGVQIATSTDDLGDYRLGGLPAGRYVLLTGPTARYDAVLVAGAAAGPPRPLQESDQTITVAAGDTVAATDITAPSPVTDRFLCPGTAVIRVPVISDTGEPVTGIPISVTAQSETTRAFGTAVTGADGVAVFDCLRAAEYTIEVARRGQAVARYGARRALKMPVTVGAGETITAPRVVLQRASAVTGTVFGEHGEPLEGVIVQPLELRWANGRSTAVRVGRARQTDDRGQFRVYGLPPGSYLLSASVDAVLSGASGDDGLGYAASYFPGTPNIGSAGMLRIDGRDVSDANIAFTPSPAARVSGIALDSEGNPVRGRVQLATSRRSGALAHEPVEMTTDEAGEFVFSNVPPGEYAVKVIRPAGLGLRTEMGSAHVSVAQGTPQPLIVRTSDGSNLAGRIVVDTPQVSSLAGLTLTAFPVDVDRVPVPVQGRGIVILGTRGEGSFYFTGVRGPTRIAVTVAPDGWYLKSVRVGAVDVTDAAVDPGPGDIDDVQIVIGTAGGSLTGRTADPSRVDDYVVIVFPADRALRAPYSRHMKLAPSSPDGTFRVSGLPPGDYLAAALDPQDVRMDGADWRDPAFLERLSPQASRVTLAERERRAVTLRVAQLR